MSTYTDAAWQELSRLVADLGKDGGLISPSIYDTAQVLRLYPPAEGAEPGLDWLIEQQRTDGGWGNPDAPYARTVPTLAALLALHSYRKDRKTRIHIDAGLAFLEEQAAIWADFQNIDLLPIAAEMILPYLIEEANRMGLAIDRQPYVPVYTLRQKKCQQISKHALKPNTPPTYSWEALGRGPQPALTDHAGGIGHSPAATAAWLHQAMQYPEFDQACINARQYLVMANHATGQDIPGIVPDVWPITGFELAYAPYAMFIANLIEHPALRDVLSGQINRLNAIMTQSHGVSFGEHFSPDVDVTGVAASVLCAKAYRVEPRVILTFKNNDHFYTYRHELNPSIFSNAHAVTALAMLGIREPIVEQFLVKHQCTDGRWLADKWHSSWLYTTLEVMLVLNDLGHTSEAIQAAGAFVQHQKSDGGWGSGSHSTRLETSYGVIALQTLQRSRLLPELGRQALLRGFDWLRLNARHKNETDEMLWLGKELYSPYRVDRVYELSAILTVTQELEFA